MSEVDSDVGAGVVVSLFLAWAQALVMGVLSLVLLAGVVLSRSDYEMLVALGCSSFATAVAIGYICRVDAARLFLAGQYAVLAISAAATMVIGLAVRGPALAIPVLLPLIISIGGAFSFVSIGTRRRCARR